MRLRREFQRVVRRLRAEFDGVEATPTALLAARGQAGKGFAASLFFSR
jgi:hypothetical protein